MARKDVADEGKIIAQNMIVFVSLLLIAFILFGIIALINPDVIGLAIVAPVLMFTLFILPFLFAFGRKGLTTIVLTVLVMYFLAWLLGKKELLREAEEWRRKMYW